ncbi:DUF3732 domain-containing protein [Blastococcus sp. KM273128]|uniref:DUF3732 domain-containing protein n=1 Tax=Blastococcus sp. KM273128 TaxID=2570314 RepID=UPI001F1758BC|nr:DUF3732 domain-containing protein [Blastococcus sp. KM273128]MCF6746148.1 DUF3732 domain-containing protein [Blastococcus sp. KM273128]
MQLLAITIYNADGRTRTVDFVPGALNIVTGESQTGKSALLTIVEYCLGRSQVLVPVGPISDTVVWYSALWQLDDGRAFVARPAPAKGKASTTLAMLEFGADLTPPPLEELRANIDTRALREQLGRHIGIEENVTEPGPGSLRQPLEANLSHAALLCLQGQNEVASSTTLFHRQGEQGIDQALRDTIPYFLGAVDRDDALKRAQLRDAKRTLTRLSNELERAEAAAATIDVELQGMFTEARAVGLISDAVAGAAADNIATADRGEVIRLLHAARTAQQTSQPLLDTVAQDERIALVAERDELRARLRRVLDDRALLLSESQAAGGFAGALEQQVERLAAVELLAATGTAGVDGDAHRNDGLRPALEDEACPACGQELAEPDPTAEALRTGLEALRTEVGALTGARPTRRRALAELDQEAERLRGELRVRQSAVSSLERAADVADGADASQRDFTRGRIDAFLSRAALTDDVHLDVLRQRIQQVGETIAALEEDLDGDNDREQLTSRLFTIGRDMSAYATLLNLEHSGDSVRLDLARLTVVTDTPTGPTPLFRIGSAANWIGYHLTAHLALHRFFTLQNRPVPRLLMLDQPTQAHYPSDADNESGEPGNDADRVAVRAMFELMRDVVEELAPRFQIIVCDHADLPEQWFQGRGTAQVARGRQAHPQ